MRLSNVRNKIFIIQICRQPASLCTQKFNKHRADVHDAGKRHGNTRVRNAVPNVPEQMAVNFLACI